MNFFCRLFGHTWIPAVEAPDVRWNTTKDMQTLAVSFDEESVRHYEECRRCGEQRTVPGRRHDADKPTNAELLQIKKDSA